MSELVYNPFEDNDVEMPVYKKDGKRLVVPLFVSGMKTKEINSRKGEELVLAELEFEVHSSVSKLGSVIIFEEDENNRYDYRHPKPEEQAVDASIFEGKRVKSGKRVTLWINKTKGSGKMNRIYIESLKNFGIEPEQKEITKDKKKIKTYVLPEPTEELLLGRTVFGWLGEESFTGKNGEEVRYSCVDKVVNAESIDRVDVIENSLSQAPKSGNPEVEADPFGDVDEDLPF